MKTLNKVFGVAVVAVVMMTTFAATVSAIEQGQTPPRATQEQIEAEKARLRRIKEGAQEKKGQEEKVSAERCQLVQERVQSKLSGYNQTKGKYTQRYDGIVNKLEDTSSKLGDNGYDTTNLDTNIETLKDMVEKFEADFVAFMDGVKSLDDTACESGEAPFLEELAESRKDLQKVRNGAAEIRVFIKGDIRQSLMDLKEQLLLDKSDESKN